MSYNGKSFKKRIFPPHPAPSTAEKGEVEKYIREVFKGKFSCSFLPFTRISNLIPVHEFSFALLLNGYFSATNLYQERSTRRGADGDVSDPNVRVSPGLMNFSMAIAGPT
jgi:hypothetical protein